MLALVTGPLAAGFEALDVVELEENVLRERGFVLVNTDGETAIPELRSSHVDVAELEASTLVEFARLVAEKVRTEGQWVRYRRLKLIELVVAAIRAKRLRLEELSDSQQEVIAKKLASS